MVSCCGLFLSFFLGIAIDSTLLSQPENDYGPRIISDHLYSISSVESIVDSRFKLLAADFQNQIDYLKGKFLKENKTASKGVFKGQQSHGIKKRQSKTLPSIPSKFANANFSCTFFFPDHPDAGLEKSKNLTFKMIKAGKEVIEKQENNNTKSIKPICEHSAPICTFNYPDHHRAVGVNGYNRTTVTNNQTAQDPPEVNKMATAFKDLLWEEMNILKINNSDQSKRIAQLEQKLAMLQNTPPASSALTRGNNKDMIKNEASYKKEQVSPALTPPSSCQDLAMLDYYLDGLYLVKNKQTKKIQTVFCKFSVDNQVSQEITGHLDVKTKTVHFYVQKSSYFDTAAVIPFEFAQLNEGNAFELASGTFTAPVSGIYHFQFSGVKKGIATSLNIYLQLNGNHVGMAIASPGKTGSFDTASLSASLRLKSGDKVRLYNVPGSVLHDYLDEHWTHFSGWLVEEDLM